MKNDPVFAFIGACILALLAYIGLGLIGIGYILVGFCLYLIGWAGWQTVPELWQSLKKDYGRQRIWRQKRKGTLKWDK